MFTAKTNLPFCKLPNEIEQNVLTVVKNNAKPFLEYRSGAGLFEMKKSSSEIFYIIWAKEAIDKSIDNCAIQTVSQGTFEPHIDGPSSRGAPRDYNLMYVLDPGGDCVTTTFYKTTDELKSKILSPGNRLERSLAEPIDVFEFKKHEWILMNNKCFHSVEGITRKRICLSISLYNKIPEFLIKVL